ncbi:Pol polyprotein [Plakobranchus ocellatus]|uniref:Pol polyprotein n=1 Tax=Plakobranchus ocellatus TaxID=259542 RepID=A0AAV3ZKC7_9GAST|nr:Pol polyprotein [Plakobranchus ocellatus]
MPSLDFGSFPWILIQPNSQRSSLRMEDFFMKRVPFGISSAREIFMRTVSEILQGIDGVICYFDDILCYSKTKEEHENLNAQVHRRLREASLQLNEAKCEYRKSEITFLGHVIDAKGCRPDPRKVEAIKDMPEPRDTTELGQLSLQIHASPINSIKAIKSTFDERHGIDLGSRTDRIVQENQGDANNSTTSSLF